MKYLAITPGLESALTMLRKSLQAYDGGRSGMFAKVLVHFVDVDAIKKAIPLDERIGVAGLLTCGHKSPNYYWPCAEPTGHLSAHQNAAAGWPRRDDDDCPPEGVA